MLKKKSPTKSGMNIGAIKTKLKHLEKITAKPKQKPEKRNPITFEIGKLYKVARERCIGPSGLESHMHYIDLEEIVLQDFYDSLKDKYDGWEDYGYNHLDFEVGTTFVVCDIVSRTDTIKSALHNKTIKKAEETKIIVMIDNKFYLTPTEHFDLLVDELKE